MALVATGAVSDEGVTNKAYSVWALPANCRVFPVGESSPDVDDGTLRQLKNTSSMWESASRRIRLVAARRETAAFQLIVQRKGDGLSDIHIRCTGLQGSNFVLAESNVHFFLAGYTREAGVFYPDILVPFTAGGVTPFSIPHQIDRLELVPGQENQSIWVDVDVPADTTAGLYRGTLTVSAGTGSMASTQTLELELEVLNVTLPAERSVAIALDVYGGIIKHLKMDSTRDEMLDLEQKFYRLAREHRMFVNAIRFAQSGAPRKGYLPEFSRGEQGELKADWADFDKRYGAYLDGTAFDDGIPVEQFCLYFNQFWPAQQWPKADFLDPACTSPEKARYEALWLEYGREYIRHFREKGWNRVLFTVKLNHYKRANQDFPLLWNTDMPRTEEDFKAVAYYAGLIHRTFSNATPIRVQFRVDPLHSFCRAAGCDFKVWDEHRAGELMKDIDLWCFEWDHGFSHPEELRKLKAKGKAVAVYRHGWTCLEPAPIFRGLGWILWERGLTGYAGWNQPHDNLKAWREDPRDNYTMYVGWDGGGKAAFPSMRLKMQRDSLADYELLKLASAQDPVRTAALAARIVRVVSPPAGESGQRFAQPIPASDPNAYAEARRELAAILYGQDRLEAVAASRGGH